MPRVTYLGYMNLIYPEYRDLDTGVILHASPGKTYNIEAIGYNAPDYPAGFVLADDEEENEEVTFPAPEIEE